MHMRKAIWITLVICAAQYSLSRLRMHIICIYILHIIYTTIIQQLTGRHECGMCAMADTVRVVEKVSLLIQRTYMSHTLLQYLLQSVCRGQAVRIKTLIFLLSVFIFKFVCSLITNIKNCGFVLTQNCLKIFYLFRR